MHYEHGKTARVFVTRFGRRRCGQFGGSTSLGVLVLVSCCKRLGRRLSNQGHSASKACVGHRRRVAPWEPRERAGDGMKLRHMGQPFV